MKTIDCPLLGRRAYSEFSISGVLAPEPAELDGSSAGQWVYARNSVPMERSEWWFHGPTQMWFRVRRNTASDDILDVQIARG